MFQKLIMKENLTEIKDLSRIKSENLLKIPLRAVILSKTLSRAGIRSRTEELSRAAILSKIIILSKKNHIIVMMTQLMTVIIIPIILIMMQMMIRVKPITAILLIFQTRASLLGIIMAVRI